MIRSNLDLQNALFLAEFLILVKKRLSCLIE